MAAFKVGQRVRYVGTILNPELPTGAEGTVVAYHPDQDACWEAVFPGYFPKQGGHAWAFPSSLAPLLPPDEAADQFIARLKKLGSEPINDAQKVAVREGK